MDNFFFHTPTKVYFGKDEELKVGKLIREYNAKKVLIHYGGGSQEKSGLLSKVRKCLKDEGYEFVFISDLILKDNYEIKHDGTQCKIKDGAE